MKGQIGITLVALIITIIVLLILAVVSIGALTDSSLLPKSRTAVNSYQNSAQQEESTLNQYSNFIDNEIAKQN